MCGVMHVRACRARVKAGMLPSCFPPFLVLKPSHILLFLSSSSFPLSTNTPTTLQTSGAKMCYHWENYGRCDFNRVSKQKPATVAAAFCRAPAALFIIQATTLQGLACSTQGLLRVMIHPPQQRSVCTRELGAARQRCIGHAGRRAAAVDARSADSYTCMHACLPALVCACPAPPPPSTNRQICVYNHSGEGLRWWGGVAGRGTCVCVLWRGI